MSQLGLNCSSGFMSGGVTSQLGLLDSCASDSAHDSQLGVDSPLGVDPAASLGVLDGAETYEPCVDPRDNMPLSIVDTFAVDNAEQTDPVRSSSAASNSRSASGVQVVVGGSTACVVTSMAFTSALAILNAWLFTLAISEAVVSSSMFLLIRRHAPFLFSFRRTAENFIFETPTVLKHQIESLARHVTVDGACKKRCARGVILRLSRCDGLLHATRRNPRPPARVAYESKIRFSSSTGVRLMRRQSRTHRPIL